MEADLRAGYLVTGSHRSGTTWVGAALAASGELHPIHEPFHPAIHTSWLSRPPTYWFEHVPPTTHARAWDEQMGAILALRPPVRAMLSRSRTSRQRAGAAREWARARAARSARRRPLLKDPIAFLSAEWMHGRFRVHPIVLVRHPAAFASSLKRLDWRFDFSNLADQPLVMSELLDAGLARAVSEAADRPPADAVGDAILLWNVTTHVTEVYRRRHPSWTIERYEDLAAEPIASFARLYRDLGLTFNRRARRVIGELSSSSNSASVADRDRGGVHRDSRAAMWTWLTRLTPDEVRRVRAGTEERASGWYSADDWLAPHLHTEGLA